MWGKGYSWVKHLRKRYGREKKLGTANQDNKWVHSIPKEECLASMSSAVVIQLFRLYKVDAGCFMFLKLFKVDSRRATYIASLIN